MKNKSLKLVALATLVTAATSLTFAAPEEGARKKPRDGDRHAQMIKRFDKDGDGKLSEAEREAAKEAMKAEGRQGPGGRGDRGKQFDKDGDGKLSDAEREAAREAMRERDGNARGDLIKRFDKDGDGKLSEEERAAAREAMQGQGDGRFRENLMKRFDKDGDGKLSDEERAEAKKARDARGKNAPEA